MKIGRYRQKEAKTGIDMDSKWERRKQLDIDREKPKRKHKTRQRCVSVMTSNVSMIYQYVGYKYL